MVDADAIYRELGKYVVCFQWLETKVVEIADFLLDPERTGRARTVLTGMAFRQLTTSADVLFAQYIANAAVENADDRKQAFHKLMVRCVQISERRNCLAHSAYLHLEAGDQLLGIIRSKGALKTGGRDGPRHAFDQEYLSPETFEEPLREIGEVGLAIGHIYLQLIHWHLGGR